MPKFTLLWLLVYFGGMFGSFINPLYGLLAYLFEYHQRPRLYWWGAWLPDWRWNLMIGVAALVTFLLHRSRLREMPSVFNPAIPWFVALLCAMGLSTTWAVDQVTSWNETIAFAKLMVIYGLIVGNVRTRGSFDAVVAVMIAGAGWWGWQAFIDPHRVSGRLVNVGSSDTLSDNLAAAHLLTVLPILCVYVLMAKNKVLRLLALGTAPFIVNTFILCNSRGATLGLIAVFTMALVLAHRKHRFRIVGVAVLVAATFFVLADQTFLDRQQTTLTDENAGRDRLETWHGALKLLKERPFGVGGGGFEYLSPIYISGIVERHYGQRRSVHNRAIPGSLRGR